MYRITQLALACALCWGGTGTATGQSFPAASPAASVTQNVGYAEVTIEYSRPRIRDREIWDVLVPYGEVWRTGANHPTFFEVSEAIRVEGRELPAGRYALYTIPGAETWTIIFSGNTELWGAYGYESSADVLRVEVVPQRSPESVESFTIGFEDVTLASARLLMRWADLEVPVRLETENLERVIEAVDGAEEGDWAAFWRGAGILLELGERPDLVTEWMERSLALERNWMNLWTAARLAAEEGDTAQAATLGEEAVKTCAEAAPACPYSATYAREIEEWRTGPRPAPRPAHPLSFLVGRWCGSGETSGAPARLTVTWERVLDGKYAKIHIQNRIESPDGEREFEGVGYYRSEGNGRLTGTWIDNLGELHPIAARLRDQELEATWGTADTKLGRSVYRVTGGRLDVEDYIKQETWARFGAASLRRCD